MWAIMWSTVKENTTTKFCHEKYPFARQVLLIYNFQKSNIIDIVIILEFLFEKR